MAASDERIPVIIGVGQINDRPVDPRQGLDPAGLMAEALRRADADAGGGWLDSCDSLGIVGQIAWPQLNPVAGTVAERLGIAPFRLADQIAQARITGTEDDALPLPARLRVCA